MLNNKVAFITGASRGIGRQTAIQFAGQGAIVVINGQNEQALQQVQAEISQQLQTEVHILPYNISDAQGTKHAFQWIKKNLGRLDVLVNNAGILDDGLLGMINHERMSHTFAVNTEAVITHMQYAARLMMPHKCGSIINVSSIMGRYGEVGQVVYSSSKAAIIGATYSAAKELAPHNIRVNAVAPGFIETAMVQGLSEEARNKRIEQIKMKRAGTPEEVANTILFLASDLSSYVTGQVIGVDGGMVV